MAVDDKINPSAVKKSFNVTQEMPLFILVSSLASGEAELGVGVIVMGEEEE